MWTRVLLSKTGLRLEGLGNAVGDVEFGVESSFIMLAPSALSSLILDGVFFRFQTGGERLLKVVHLRGGRMSDCLRPLSSLLRGLIRLRLCFSPVTDCAHARTNRRPLAGITRDGADEGAAGSSAHRAFYSGSRRGRLRLLLLLRGLLLLLGSLLGNMEGVVARLLHRPVVAFSLILRLLRGGLAGARKRVDFEGSRQRLRSARRANEWGLGLELTKRRPW